MWRWLVCPKLSDKQRKFADIYIKCLNASEAYRQAGYSCKSDDIVKSAASRLLANVNVKQYVNKRQTKLQQKIEVTQEMILKELAVIAFQDRTNLAKVVVENGKKIVDVTETDKLSEGDKSVIAGIKQGKNGIEVSTHDKMKALELLGKHLGMFSDKAIDREEFEDDGFIKAVSGSASTDWVDTDEE